MIEEAPKKPAPSNERGRVAQAYARLFGTSDETRNEDQRVVWQDMERRGFTNRPVLQRDATGAVITENTTANAGKQEFHQDTRLLVHEGRNADPEAKPKRKGKSIR